MSSYLSYSLFGATLLLAMAPFAQGQVTTDPVGFVSTAVPANSDAILAVPLSRPSVYKGVIQSVSGNTITVAGTSPAWSTNQFVQSLPAQVNTYAMQVASGTKEGLTAKITASTANTLTVQLDSADDLTGVNTEVANGVGFGDHIDILPYWTPSSLITSAIPTNSQMLLLESTAAGVNLSSSAVLTYDTGVWYDSDFNENNHYPLSFGRSFIFRNAGSATTLTMVGSVPMNKHRVVIRNYGAGSQDVGIGFSSPVPVAIGSIGLSFSDDDQLLVFNNSAVGQNKSASQVLYYSVSEGWTDDSFNPIGSSFMLQPGQGYIFRKKGSGSAGAVVWSGLQPYLAP